MLGHFVHVGDIYILGTVVSTCGVCFDLHICGCNVGCPSVVLKDNMM